MSRTDRVALYIDGSNFYHKLKSLGIHSALHFDFHSFAQWLARVRDLVFAGYYVGVVRAQRDDDKGQLLRRNQQRLFSRLRSHGFVLRRGYLMRADGVYHEKGVDVQIAVDLLVGAYEDLYDTAILVSSDTDLLPAMAKVKSLGKEIEYIGFAHESSIAMQTHATLSRLLIKEELEPFFERPQTLT